MTTTLWWDDIRRTIVTDRQIDEYSTSSSSCDRRLFCYNAPEKFDRLIAGTTQGLIICSHYPIYNDSMNIIEKVKNVHNLSKNIMGTFRNYHFFFKNNDVDYISIMRADDQAYTYSRGCQTKIKLLRFCSIFFFGNLRPCG